MSDLIDREALLKRLHGVGGCGAPPESWADGYDKAMVYKTMRKKEDPCKS